MQGAQPEIRRLHKSELEEAVNLAVESSRHEIDARGEPVYPWPEEEQREYYRRAYSGVFGKPRTALLGRFLEGKLVGVVYATPVTTWLGAMNEREKNEQVEQAVNMLNARISEVGYAG